MSPIASADPWGGTRDFIRVMLRDIVTEAHVGLHPWERHPQRPTRLLVNIEMFAALNGSAGAIGEGLIDYDPVRAALDTFETPSEFGISTRIARLDAANVMEHVISSIFDAGIIDPVVVFGVLADHAARAARDKEAGR